MPAMVRNWLEPLTRHYGAAVTDDWRRGHFAALDPAVVSQFSLDRNAWLTVRQASGEALGPERAAANAVRRSTAVLHLEAALRAHLAAKGVPGLVDYVVATDAEVIQLHWKSEPTALDGVDFLRPPLVIFLIGDQEFGKVGEEGFHGQVFAQRVRRVLSGSGKVWVAYYEDRPLADSRVASRGLADMRAAEFLPAAVVEVECCASAAQMTAQTATVSPGRYAPAPAPAPRQVAPGRSIPLPGMT